MALRSSAERRSAAGQRQPELDRKLPTAGDDPRPAHPRMKKFGLRATAYVHPEETIVTAI
jgi:hypothetical protein